MDQIYATGGRKTSTARVFLRKGSGKITVNGKDFKEYFHNIDRYIREILQPFEITELLGQYDVYATVKGGGMTGQAEAIRHGIAKCIAQIDVERYKPMLRKAGLITRDPRMVERKKYGLKKARKAPQYSKR